MGLGVNKVLKGKVGVAAVTETSEWSNRTNFKNNKNKGDVSKGMLEFSFKGLEFGLTANKYTNGEHGVEAKLGIGIFTGTIEFTKTGIKSWFIGEQVGVGAVFGKGYEATQSFGLKSR